jgi:hypothetical protein
MDGSPGFASLANRILSLMLTMMAVVALATSVSTSNISPNPTWLDDYATAQQRVALVHKPMVVFVGNGPEGWRNVVRDGGLTPTVSKLLADKFVCLYVDTSTAAGRTLAGSFEVAHKGLVISDKAGTTQAYSLSGDLSGSELVRTLEKYADAADARSTETVVRDAPAIVRPATTVSYPVQPAYAPQYRVVPGYTTGGT